MPKSIDEVQENIDDYIKNFEEGYWPELVILARLTEEIGELARELNSEYGKKPKKKEHFNKNIEMEIGDTLFTLICLSNSLDINLDEALNKTLRKYKKRNNERWTKK